MRDIVEKLARGFGLLAKLSLYLSGAGLVAMTGFIAWQVYGRYVLNDTPTWTGNGSVITMGWFIILGAAVGIREGNRLGFDVLLHVLGPRAKAVVHTLTTPIFLPVATAVGVDPVHFGIIMVLNLGIGFCTSPVGAVLFVGCAVGKVPVGQVIRTIWPFYLAAIVTLMIVTYIPAMSLWLPSVF